jgi:hypothetical protein
MPRGWIEGQFSGPSKHREVPSMACAQRACHEMGSPNLMAFLKRVTIAALPAPPAIHNLSGSAKGTSICRLSSKGAVTEAPIADSPGGRREAFEP